MTQQEAITSIEPYEATTIQDTTDENRTDLPAWAQRVENELALHNQLLRQFLERMGSIFLTQEVSISSTEIAANNGNLVRTDIPAIAGYKAVGVVGMKIGMNFHTMYWGLENNNTRLRTDFLNRASTAFSGSPGVATILYLRDS